mgnify:CR=1 FL=1
MKETDLFQPIKEWLEERDYEVYTEVISTKAGGRADVVGVSGPAVAVVEMKNSLTLEVVAQAIRWKLYSNYIYIAVPCNPKRRVSNYVCNLLIREGIGLLEVSLSNQGRKANILVSSKCRYYRRVDDHIRNSLTPKHQLLPGGHAGGGYITTYSKTIDRVKDFLQYGTHGEWTTLDEILNHCETHWASPKPSLAQSIRKFEMDWCETKKEGRKVLYRINLSKTIKKG